MAEFIVNPHPEVILSDADERQLPLTSFHLVVIVEADPESYMPLPGDIEKLGEVLYNFFVPFEAEIDPENPVANPDKHPLDVDKTIFIWLRYDDENVNYFSNFAEAAFTKVNFTLNDYEDFEQLEYYLKGVIAEHPDWRAGIIGAMFEDEVIGVANLLQRTGFATTVLMRYCLSNQVFINLDNLSDYVQWVRLAGREQGDPFHSWFDEWIEDHGIEIDSEIDEDELGEDGEDNDEK